MYNTDMPTRADLPSSQQLVRSTFLAAAVAGVLLLAVVLPAEYGIDPTGVGSALGLKKMGEIKTALASEAAQDKTSTPAPAAIAPVVAVAAAPVVPVAKPTPQIVGKTDEVTVELKPGQSAEVKLDMREGAKVQYKWTVAGGSVNHDTHGDPLNPPVGFYHGYSKGRQISNDAGVLKAAFDGQHGWFWRNRSPESVTVTLNTQGEYTAVKRVK